MRAVLAVAVLVPLLGLSVLAQCWTRLRARWGHRFGMRVVPSWRFFGPAPMVAVVHLLMRSRVGRSDPTAWAEVPVPSQQRGRAIWNPSRFADKAVHDLTNSLVAACHDLRDRTDEVV